MCPPLGVALVAVHAGALREALPDTLHYGPTSEAGEGGIKGKYRYIEETSCRPQLFPGTAIQRGEEASLAAAVRLLAGLAQGAPSPAAEVSE